MFFYLHLIQLQTSNFQFLQTGCVGKIEKNRCSRGRCCCCYSVSPPRFRQISRSYFFKQKLEIFSCIAYRSSMLFLTIFGEVMFHLIKVNWEFVFILMKFARGTFIWNSLSSACTSMWGLWKLFHPVKQWLKSFLRDYWPFTTVQSR